MLVVTIKSYNEMADFYYSHFELNDAICVKGRINTKGEIIIKNSNNHLLFLLF